MSEGERLVPDGCVDVLWAGSDHLWICGPERRAWRSSRPEGTEAVGVRLRPGAARHLLKTDVHHVVDRRLRVAEVRSPAHERMLLDRLEGSDDPLHVLVAEVRRWRDRSEPPSAQDEAIVRAATARRPLGVGALAEGLGVTPRHLHRRSLRLFGYSYSVLVRLLRFQRFLHQARLRPGTGMAAAAAVAGYADQAHLVRECRSITGLAPGALLAETDATFPTWWSDPYKTDEPRACGLGA